MHSSQQDSIDVGGIIGEESWNIDNMYQKDILLLIVSIDADNHLSPGNNMMSSCA
jgi:hypothetical protein